ncbi:AbrB/MazE/SpoVT family DNA-binding domain-containing protein [Patescibacteria group bacterium]|nr:AbrB/MazE/SpoVT family DNA-binding domain-containing protein [Patescibacteria group bacterium]
MKNTVRISSKRQITIPARVFLELRLEEGDQLTVKRKNNSLVLEKAEAVLDRLENSVELPKKYKGLSLNQVIRRAREEYFTDNP